MRHERGVHRQQHDVHSASGTPRDLANFLSALAGDVKELGTAVAGGRRTTRQIRIRLGELREGGELLLPPSHLPGNLIALHPLTVPLREVTVGDLQRRQWRGFAGDERFVQRGKLVVENIEGRAIPDHVMRHEQHRVIFRVHLEQARAEQRRDGQIETVRDARLDALQQHAFAIGLGNRRQVFHRQKAGIHGIVDALNVAVRGFHDGGAQHGLTTRHLDERAIERLEIHRAAEAMSGWRVVHDASGLHLLDEVNALLHEGQRSAGLVRAMLDRRATRGIRALLCRDHSRDLLGRRRLEQHP